MTMAQTGSGPGLLPAASWSLAGQVGFYGLQWLNMIILARLSGPEAVGLYTLGLALSNPIMALGSLMFRMVYITDQQSRWSFAEYKAVRRIALPVSVLAIAAIALALGYRDLPLVVILLAASWKMAETLSDVNYAIPHKAGDMRAIALSMVARAAVSSLVLAIALKLTARLDLSLLAFSVVWWLFYYFCDRRFEQGAEAKQGAASQRDLIRFAMPMALSAAVVYLTFSLPRIILDHFENTAILGIFAAISHVLLIGALVVNSLGSAITPRLSRLFAAGNLAQYYREVAIGVGAAVFVSLGFITVAMIAGEYLITLIYGRAIGSEGGLIVAMSLASLPIYVGSMLGFVPPALQAYRFHLAVNLITVAGTTLAAFWFIPEHGALGAIYAIAVQGILQLLNALILFRKPAARD